MIDIKGEITRMIDCYSTPFKVSKIRGNIAKHKDMPYPVGSDTKTFFPRTKVVTASSCSALRVEHPRCNAAFCTITCRGTFAATVSVIHAVQAILAAAHTWGCGW